MAIELRHDLREQARAFFEASTSIYTVAGQAIADGIWEEFEQLVKETAQYTGSTAASWNIDKKFGASFGQVEMIKLGKGQSPLHIGHSVAVNIALNRSRGRLDGLGKKVLTSGINVWNESAAAEIATETGPVRPINSSAIGAFSRFKERVGSKVFEPLSGQYTLKQLNEKARAIRKG